VYYADEAGTETAQKITDKIIASLKRLSAFPLSGSYPPDDDMKKNGFRMAVAGSYISVYRVVDKVVYVYHIFHGSRDYVGLFSGYVLEEDGKK
jgi:plasmid stabilization system protein ParE